MPSRDIESGQNCLYSSTTVTKPFSTMFKSPMKLNKLEADEASSTTIPVTPALPVNSTCESSEAETLPEPVDSQSDSITAVLEPRRCPKEDELWTRAFDAVRQKDGTADTARALSWIMTQKGGGKAKWTELEEAKKGIENIRRSGLDVARIRRQMEEEQDEVNRREQRRLANKLRYRPRSQWTKKRKTPAEKAPPPSKKVRHDSGCASQTCRASNEA